MDIPASVTFQGYLWGIILSRPIMVSVLLFPLSCIALTLKCNVPCFFDVHPNNKNISKAPMPTKHFWGKWMWVTVWEPLGDGREEVRLEGTERLQFSQYQESLGPVCHQASTPSLANLQIKLCAAKPTMLPAILPELEWVPAGRWEGPCHPCLGTSVTLALQQAHLSPGPLRITALLPFECLLAWWLSPQVKHKLWKTQPMLSLNVSFSLFSSIQDKIHLLHFL